MAHPAVRMASAISGAYLGIMSRPSPRATAVPRSPGLETRDWSQWCTRGANLTLYRNRAVSVSPRHSRPSGLSASASNTVSRSGSVRNAFGRRPARVARARSCGEDAQRPAKVHLLAVGLHRGSFAGRSAALSALPGLMSSGPCRFSHSAAPGPTHRARAPAFPWGCPRARRRVYKGDQGLSRTRSRADPRRGRATEADARRRRPPHVRAPSIHRPYRGSFPPEQTNA